MGASNCFTCHAATTKLIGPSFDLIAKRYTSTPETVDALAKKILVGTAGVWGPVAMPPHPDFNIVQLHMNLSVVSPFPFATRWKIEPQRDIARTHQAA